VKAVVHHGHITLTGVVPSPYQKNHAERIMRHVRGARGVFNHVLVGPRAGDRDAEKRINAALGRMANTDPRDILVAVDGDTATLTGTVGSWRERDSVGRAAADGPGIRSVVNRLAVEPTTSDEAGEISLGMRKNSRRVTLPKASRP
jgi:osmotically-inducible protein OsmY